MSRAAPTNADLMDQSPTCLTPLCQPPHPVAAWRLSLGSAIVLPVPGSNDEATSGTVGNTSLRRCGRCHGHNLLVPCVRRVFSCSGTCFSVGASTASQPSCGRRRTEGILQPEKYRFLSTGSRPTMRYEPANPSRPRAWGRCCLHEALAGHG
jgi:hypothetical protein